MKVVDNLDVLLAAQDGLVRHDQLKDCGVTRATLRWRVDSGQWRVLLPSVYVTVSGTPTARQRMLAASLYAGRQAQITGVAALRWYGLGYLPDDPAVRVLVPHARQVPSTGFVRVHRTRRLDPYARPMGSAQVCCVARAVADASRWCASPRAVRALVAESLQRELASEDQLRRELEQGPRAGCALLRRILDELAGGGRAPEAQLRELLAGSPILPPIWWSPTLVGLPDRQPLPSPDGWIDEAGLALEVDALEVDSAEHRLRPDDWEHTMRRHHRLAGYGALVLHFPPSRIHQDPSGVRREVERAYLERLRSRARAAISGPDEDRGVG